MSIIDVSLANILLSSTSSIESRGQSKTEPGLFTSLFRVFLSVFESKDSNETLYYIQAVPLYVSVIEVIIYLPVLFMSFAVGGEGVAGGV